MEIKLSDGNTLKVEAEPRVKAFLKDVWTSGTSSSQSPIEAAIDVSSERAVELVRSLGAVASLTRAD